MARVRLTSLLYAFGVSLLLGLFSGCAEEAQPSLPCTPDGPSISCVCPGGASGTQSCADDGSRYNPCDCEAPADVVSSDTADDTSGDAGDAGDTSGPDTIEPPEDTGPSDTVEPIDAGLPPCEPPLAIAPPHVYANPYSLVAVQASGGTGAYVFEMVEDQSSGTLNHLTGSYLTGPDHGVTDTFRVIDDGCVGEAMVTVEVVSEMVAAPNEVTLKPGGTFTFEAYEGSGAIEFLLSTDGSGASVSAEGVYVAGQVEADDVVTIFDSETLQVINAVVHVKEDAELVPIPRVLVLPMGASYALQIEGGSGFFEVQVTGEAVVYEEGRFHGMTDGSVSVDVTDEFTGATTTFTATTIDGLSFENHRAGDHLAVNRAVGAGDINGDGYPDAILGVAESHIDWVSSGGVFIYAGGPDGLAPNPARVISGPERLARFGGRVIADDVDGDGLVDLLVAASRANAGATIAGAVYLYRGVPDDFFEAEPSQMWSGDFGYDFFGFSLTTCDFNGDGAMDMAVAAYGGEDRDADPVVSGQGVVNIFLGTGSGLSIAPNLRLWGHGLTEDGQWLPLPVEMGQSMTSGDMDNDGLCDLVVSVFESKGDDNRDGAIYIFRGVAPEGFSKGGVTKLPVRAIFTDAAGDYLGWDLTAADYDNDNNVDLAIGHAHSMQNGKDAAGAVYLFKGGDLPDSIIGPESPADADWTYAGKNGGDYEGIALNSGDVNGDGYPDLMVGSRTGETPSSPSNVGSLRAFYGGDGTSFGATPDYQSGGLANGDWYGLAMAALGDVDKNGDQDLLVYAARSGVIGFHHGLGFQISMTPGEETPSPLDQPGMASGQYFGNSVALVTIKAGTEPVAVVGAAHHDTASAYNRGAVFTYTSDGDGFVGPQQSLGDFPKVGSNDRLGISIASIGDFNGDGFGDLAVVLESEYKPSSFDNAMVCGPSCAPAHQGNKGCQGTVNYPGSVVIFGGKADGTFNPQPLFQYYSPEEKQNTRSVAFAGDVNGDGLSDVLIGCNAWDGPAKNTGGFRLIYGRPQEGYSVGKIQAICAEDFTYHGHIESDQMGRGLTTVGDLNGDDCAEFAVGADLEDPSNQGVVRVFFGWNSNGQDCDHSTAQFAAIASGAGSSRAGYSLAGGHDVDGDGKPDLVVGAPFYRVSSASVGGAWLVRGSYLLTLPLEAAQSGVAPTIGPHSLASGVEVSNLKVTGQVTGDDLGFSVSLIPNAEADGRAMVVVGSPGSSVPGDPQTGAALVYRYQLGESPGLNPRPWLIVGGESYRLGGRFGAAVAGGLGQSGPLLIVGAYFGTGSSTDAGSAYVIPLPPAPGD